MVKKFRPSGVPPKVPISLRNRIILAMLEDRMELSAGEIAKDLYLSLHTIEVELRYLEGLGLVERVK